MIAAAHALKSVAIILLLVNLLLPIVLVVRLDGTKGILWSGGIVWLLEALVVFGIAVCGVNPAMTLIATVWLLFGWVFAFGYAALIYGVKELFRHLRARANDRTA